MTDQLNLDLFAPTHKNDPDTSRVAARKASTKMRRHYDAILRALYEAGERGLTADEMLPATGITQRHVAQTRAGEMTPEHLKTGWHPYPLVEATKVRRNTSPSGGPAVVYVLNETGREVAERLVRSAA